MVVTLMMRGGESRTLELNMSEYVGAGTNFQSISEDTMDNLFQNSEVRKNLLTSSRLRTYFDCLFLSYLTDTDLGIQSADDYQRSGARCFYRRHFPNISVLFVLLPSSHRRSPETLGIFFLRPLPYSQSLQCG